MAVTSLQSIATGANIEYWNERVDIAAALRWTARMNIFFATSVD